MARSAAVMVFDLLAREAAWVSILLSFGALGLLALADTAPGAMAVTSAHGLGTAILIVAWALWAMGVRPGLAFTAMAASAASMIFNAHLLLGLLGMALLVAAQAVRVRAVNLADAAARDSSLESK